MRTGEAMPPPGQPLAAPEAATTSPARGSVSDDTVAPDGAAIHVLLRTGSASMACGSLAVGQTSRAVTHRTVEEMWYVVSGRAEVWRRDGGESTVTVAAGDALAVPLGVAFQYRTLGDVPFEFVMCTMPAWPGPDEAVLVPGPWTAGDTPAGEG